MVEIEKEISSRGYLNMKPKSFCVIFALFVGFSSFSVKGQDGGNIIDSSIKDVTTVAALGAGGAILGLSTLSFVDEPKDNLKMFSSVGPSELLLALGLSLINKLRARQMT